MTDSNKLATCTDFESDFGWKWVIRALTVLYQNVCYIEGVVNEEQSLTGIVEESQDITAKIGCGEKL